MTQRIFAVVNRGMTDKTAVCIYPWEKQILELVHGQEIQLVSIDQMCDMTGVAKIEKIKMNHGSQLPPSLRDQLIEMVMVDPDLDPVNDPQTEYNRLVGKYGMDKDVPISCVARIFGEYSSGNFEREVVKLSRDRPHGKLVKGKVAETDPENMTIGQIRAKLTSMGQGWDEGGTKKELLEQLKSAQPA